jgi:hypothetical protein
MIDFLFITLLILLPNAKMGKDHAAVKKELLTVEVKKEDGGFVFILEGEKKDITELKEIVRGKVLLIMVEDEEITIQDLKFHLMPFQEVARGIFLEVK